MTIDYPAAVLWDMDGTLVDSEPYWMKAELELIHEYGGTWSHEEALQMVGAGLWVSAEVFQSRGVDLSPDEIVTRLTDRVQQQIHDGGIPWRPGARELLAEVRDAGIPTALVTMSVRRMAQQVVDEIPYPAFDLLVTGDEVNHPKPHPDAYQSAAQRLGVDPSLTIAIEDSVAGLGSAVAAGTVAIGVPHILTLPESPDYTLWPSLEHRTLADLVSVLRARRELIASGGSRP
ncbi:HAD family hydrolase [Rathayibacter soli]|uniref:HAD family hydrolase n=1 Tax=Rathayibacter soli TaxID=3144168 RepID=UPI0027E3E7C9|nr:HAD family phosphatase [Glaciibacter superstes]